MLFVTLGKEAYDDYKRNLRDREANSQKYLILEGHENDSAITRAVPSSSWSSNKLTWIHKFRKKKFKGF